MRRGTVLACLAWIALGACGAKGDGGGANPDAAPIKLKVPPVAKDGTSTVASCDGVTARGECREGVATYCDLERETLRKIDCKAQSMDCLVDSARGAICKGFGDMMKPPTDPATTCMDTGIDRNGFCTGTTAVWCDKDKNQTVTWDCAADGLSCQKDTCRDGAFCCTADGKDPPGHPDGTDECNGLDFKGTCEGTTAKWCENGKLRNWDCAASGKSCEKDTCADGSYCCGGSAEDECSRIGITGICAGNTARICAKSSGKPTPSIQELVCPAGESCEMFTCSGLGAACCAPIDTTGECGQIGYAGVCEGNTMKYCNGGRLISADCTESGDTCQIGGCGGEGAAWCCPQVTGCGGIDEAGVCQGNILKYCENEELQEFNCQTDFTPPRTCDPDGSQCGFGGQAACCPP